MSRRDPHLAAARIIQDADGNLVGRTRLQKVAYLMQLAGFSDEFDFEYRHFGPYSEALAQAMEIASILGPVHEIERPAEWGGFYSIYTLREPQPPENSRRAAFVQAAKSIGAIELELAATSAFLFAKEGFDGSLGRNPWDETRRRKPDKSKNGRLERAAAAYAHLRRLSSPTPLPSLPPLG